MFHDDAMHLDMPIATVDQHTPVKQSVDLLDEPEFLLQQQATGQLVWSERSPAVRDNPLRVDLMT